MSNNVVPSLPSAHARDLSALKKQANDLGVQALKYRERHDGRDERVDKQIEWTLKTCFYLKKACEIREPREPDYEEAFMAD